MMINKYNMYVNPGLELYLSWFCNFFLLPFFPFIHFSPFTHPSHQSLSPISLSFLLFSLPYTLSPSLLIPAMPSGHLDSSKFDQLFFIMVTFHLINSVSISHKFLVFHSVRLLHHYSQVLPNNYYLFTRIILTC